MGLSNANNIIIINKYFKKRVGAAYGLLLTGFGLGGLAMPQVYINAATFELTKLTGLR